MKPTAVVGRRVGAYLLDYVVYYAIIGAVFFALAQKDTDLIRQVTSGDLDPDATLYGNVTIGDTQYSVTGGRAGIFFLISIVVGLANFVVLPGVRGWSIGKLMTGIRLIKDDGNPKPGVGRSFLRQLLWIADGFPYIIPNLVGFIMALTNNQNKRIGDMVAGTLVVKKEYAGQAVAAPAAGLGGGGYGDSGGSPLDITGAAPPVHGTAAMPAITPGQAFTPQPEPVAAPAAPDPASPPADWYPDPKGEKRLRYWDGSTWTDHTAD